VTDESFPGSNKQTCDQLAIFLPSPSSNPWEERNFLLTADVASRRSLLVQKANHRMPRRKSPNPKGYLAACKLNTFTILNTADGYGLVLARTNIRPSCFAIILSTSLFGRKSGKDQFFSLCGMAV
jgi:hypothetical protein